MPNVEHEEQRRVQQKPDTRSDTKITNSEEKIIGWALSDASLDYSDQNEQPSEHIWTPIKI